MIGKVTLIDADRAAQADLPAGAGRAAALHHADAGRLALQHRLHALRRGKLFLADVELRDRVPNLTPSRLSRRTGHDHLVQAKHRNRKLDLLRLADSRPDVQLQQAHAVANLGDPELLAAYRNVEQHELAVLVGLRSDIRVEDPDLGPGDRCASALNRHTPFHRARLRKRGWHEERQC